MADEQIPPQEGRSVAENIPVPQPPSVPAMVPAAAVPVGPVIAAVSTMICPQCHFPVKPEYYYCPNCGTKLSEPAVATDLITQILLYAFSIILPWIAYLAITKWPGIKYLRAPDAKAKTMGLIMLALLVISSVVAFWLTYVWIQGYIQQSLNGVSNLENGL
jgi:hypothetical protein